MQPLFSSSSRFLFPLQVKGGKLLPAAVHWETLIWWRRRRRPCCIVTRSGRGLFSGRQWGLAFHLRTKQEQNQWSADREGTLLDLNLRLGSDGRLRRVENFPCDSEKKVFSKTQSELNPNFSFREKLAITQKAQVKKNKSAPFPVFLCVWSSFSPPQRYAKAKVFLVRRRRIAEVRERLHRAIFFF